MKLAEAKEEFRELVAHYFGSDHVFFANSKMTKMPEPYVTIQFTGVERQVHETKVMSPDGYGWAYREMTASVDLNLYTRGRSVGGSRTVFINTALDDIVSFLDYLGSDEGFGYQYKRNMAIAVVEQPRDLSALVREAQFQYRAMVGLTVRFTDMTYGGYGQNNNEIPNPSGGGDKKMVTEASYIEEAEITAQTESEQ